MELERLRALAPGVRRRVLRAASKQLGAGLNFEQTQRLMAMCEVAGAKGQQLSAELQAEKTARELRLIRESVGEEKHVVLEPIVVAIPGEVTGFGVTLRLVSGETGLPAAILRAPKAGDRVRLRYSRGAKPLKEIFERMNIETEARKSWPVLEWEGRIVWMKDVALEPEAGFPFVVELVRGDS
jgi:tRNA(Ile)-lysidine synthase